MAYDIGKIVVADPLLNQAVQNALEINSGISVDNRTRIQRNSMMEATDVVAESYNGNFNLIDRSYTMENGTRLQRVDLCGRNVKWENVSNHIFTEPIADPTYYYVNGVKKTLDIYPLSTQLGVSKDVTWYIYFVAYEDSMPYPLTYDKMDATIEEVLEYNNITATIEPSNMLLIGSVRFNSDGTTEVEQIYRDEGIPSLYIKSSGTYSGPFMVTWHNSFMLKVSAPPEYMGGNNLYAGTILAPDMQVVKHIRSDYATFEEGQENTLLVLTIRWDRDNDIESFTEGFQFVPDPWKTCAVEDKEVAINFLNPKNEDYPYRDPYIAIYPLARIEGRQIVQIQKGHIVEYNRWWRS